MSTKRNKKAPVKKLSASEERRIGALKAAEEKRGGKTCPVCRTYVPKESIKLNFNKDPKGKVCNNCFK